MKDKINKILRKISMALLVDPLYLLRGEREYFRGNIYLTTSE